MRLRALRSHASQWERLRGADTAPTHVSPTATAASARARGRCIALPVAVTLRRRRRLSRQLRSLVLRLRWLPLRQVGRSRCQSVARVLDATLVRRRRRLPLRLSRVRLIWHGSMRQCAVVHRDALSGSAHPLLPQLVQLPQLRHSLQLARLLGVLL